MGFWVFTMIMDLLFPFTMIGFGKYFMKDAPKEINDFFGYRTHMSMKNKDTWRFAHQYCGRLWFSIGWIMLILSIIVMLCVIGKDTNFIGNFGAILCFIQLAFLIGTIFPTEVALRKHFDKHGKRRK